jgi:hypothetical protein
MQSDLQLTALTLPEVCHLLEVLLPLPPRSFALYWTWSLWRRGKLRLARESHHRRAQRKTQLQELASAAGP